MVRKWLHYAGGALGLGVVSVWLFRHSQLGGSDDLNRWTKEALDAATGFLEEHLKKPVFFSCTKPSFQPCCDLPLNWRYNKDSLG